MAERTSLIEQRTAQDLVDWAKRELIPRHCPQWTDHNVSDPGIALIEIFAAMVETLGYRVNRIPERVEQRLLRLIGVAPEGPRQATAPLSFELSKAASAELTLAAGVEVATQRRPGEPEVIFTTTQPLTLYPAQLSAAQTHQASRGSQGWQAHQIRHGQIVAETAIFPSSPRAGDRPDNGDAFYLGFELDVSSHTIALHLDCAGGLPRGLNPDLAPLVWQAHAPRDGDEWVRCDVEDDTTRGFSQPGVVRLHLPAGIDRSLLNGVAAFWVRCLIDGATSQSEYQVAPRVRSLRAETWGGTVAAEHAAAVINEEIGRSDGTPGQTFRLRQRPLLRLEDSRDEALLVEHEGRVERWSEVPDLSASGPDDRHYMVDYINGTITLGPALLQPDGTLHSFGSVPPQGSRLRMQRYRYGGGASGNVARGELRVIKSARPYLARVWNRQPARGGLDAQTTADAAMRAPAVLRSRDRAVTADDFVQLACAIPGVARAYCDAPGNQRAPAGAHQPPPPGKVRLAILPAIDRQEIAALIDAERNLDPARVRPSADLRTHVLQRIKPLCPLGVSFELDSVAEPALVWVWARIEARVPAAITASERQRVERALRQAMFRFLHPYCGGAEGKGWPFGRGLRVFDLAAAVQPLLGGGVIEQIELAQVDPGLPARGRQPTPQIAVPPHGLIGLYQADVTIMQEA